MAVRGKTAADALRPPRRAVPARFPAATIDHIHDKAHSNHIRFRTRKVADHPATLRVVTPRESAGGVRLTNARKKVTREQEFVGYCKGLDSRARCQSTLLFHPVASSCCVPQSVSDGAAAQSSGSAEVRNDAPRPCRLTKVLTQQRTYDVSTAHSGRPLYACEERRPRLRMPAKPQRSVDTSGEPSHGRVRNHVRSKSQVHRVIETGIVWTSATVKIRSVLR